MPMTSHRRTLNPDATYLEQPSLPTWHRQLLGGWRQVLGGWWQLRRDRGEGQQGEQGGRQRAHEGRVLGGSRQGLQEGRQVGPGTSLCDHRHPGMGGCVGWGMTAGMRFQA